ncbi:MAG TPA: FAD-dependent oxidoreductase [Gammaproteobacteria bacterium]|nr:FAD-dependent oxidoreductase [Gammaproteobacteria bacterium]HKH19533.1 FAD-dependent oxidoreductase [Gammaproteobacteria bacterium]
MDKEERFDVCVIGAGSGGLSVAAGAAQLGLNTALVEQNKMGGECLYTGCVPSKALLQAARVAQTFRKAGAFGMKAQEPDVDFSAVKDHVYDVIAAIAPHDSQERFEGLGVSVIRAATRFTGPDTVTAGEQMIKARYIVVATGSRPTMPPIEGLEPGKALTNENIFELREKPDHLVIIGGGPIGIEMAQAHRRLGCKVTVLDMGPILPKDDPELVAVLRERLQEEGIDCFEHTKIVRIEHGQDTVAVRGEKDGNGISVTGSHLLVAAGRQPSVDSLDLEKAGVRYSKRGIEVDKRLRSSNKRIYAAGDVTGGPQFTHIAGYHAGIIIRNIAFKIPARVDYAALPWVTYTDPELANVGLTEAIAIEQFGREKIRTVSWHFDENDRAQTEHRTEGLIKVTLLKSGKIVGATILGPHAGELIGLWAHAISQKQKIGALTDMIAPYPTLGEVSKRVAGAWYIPRLFSDRTRRIVGLLQKLPF